MRIGGSGVLAICWKNARMDSQSARAARDIPTILVEYAGIMAEHRHPREILERLADYCTELLPVDSVGSLLRDTNGGLVIATANTEAGRIAESLEVELGEGPCVESMATGSQIAVPDVAAAFERYPRFAPRALEAGVGAIHALPLTARVEQIGSLDLVAFAPLDLTAAQLATAQMLADVTVAYLANTRAFADATRLAEQLQHALDSRIVIEQAKGKLSERRGITVSEAFEVLRRHARNHGKKLHDIAAAFMRDELEP